MLLKGAQLKSTGRRYGLQDNCVLREPSNPSSQINTIKKREDPNTNKLLVIPSRLTPRFVPYVSKPAKNLTCLEIGHKTDLLKML